MRRLANLALAASLAFCGTAMAVQGPTQSPLKVSTMYTNNNSSALYVAFQVGAMPGCYNNSGGYLYTTNAMFKELHAQLLTMVATGGIRAVVVYTQNTPTNNWGDCTIDGIYLLPE